MLEFAIGSGVLVAVFAGTFQFGYNFYRYNTLATAVSNGARYASLRPYDLAASGGVCTDYSNAYRDAVKNIVVFGDPTGNSTIPVSPGLTTANVQITSVCSSNVAGKGVPLTITVSITNYTLNAIFGQITYNTKPQVTYAYEGVYSPY
jgi:Flp pilus assembly protein TadG